MQATYTGFNEITAEYVFKVCDVPNIGKMKKIINYSIEGDFNEVLNHKDDNL